MSCGYGNPAADRTDLAPGNRFSMLELVFDPVLILPYIIRYQPTSMHVFSFLQVAGFSNKEVRI